MIYDKYPAVSGRGDCVTGWEAIGGKLRATGARVIVIESYTGVRQQDLAELVRAIGPDLAVDAADALKASVEIDTMVYPDVTDDPVFGRITQMSIKDFFELRALDRLRSDTFAARGTVVVYGTGASLIAQGDLLVYADMPRWEGTLRQRSGETSNLGAKNLEERPALKYKRAYFVDWRVLDQMKQSLYERMDFVLDTTDRSQPKMIEGTQLRESLNATATRPFRVVPYFDPAPWGGEWMRRVCELSPEPPNYGWCFDCVPEENSLLIDFGGTRFETPALNLVFREPARLLGDRAYEKFGAEFPIRFDFLDTMGGGNLSMQVHPLTEYIRDKFGMQYTQDESYYLMDAGPDASVYLGVKEGIDPAGMIADLKRAEGGDFRFPDEKYVNKWPARRHDHFLIPAGTVHCSGANSMVLEISATPYIFTFKLWDWDRLGLDGRPRPVHVDHGANNIQWDRDTDWVKRELINRSEKIAEGDGWTEEKTGLHEKEPIETRRHWFTKICPHDGAGGVNVLNLVEGEEVLVESPDRAFDPFIVHYAETFIVPAAAGPYSIRPHGPGEGKTCGTIKASIR
ncbi:MAG TPA: class I mannose-6-phosphate isomerase [Actinomycetota bacterium]|nr:class I mannose-6-phosphate isomerase [Actinomycetota bacterium]